MASVVLRVLERLNPALILMELCPLQRAKPPSLLGMQRKKPRAWGEVRECVTGGSSGESAPHQIANPNNTGFHWGNMIGHKPSIKISYKN